MKTSSAKAKGRRLQNHVAQRLRALLALSEDDIRPQLMGGTGVDILLSSRAKQLFPLAIECKNQESLNIWAALKQASQNTKGGEAPAVVFTRNREKKTYIALDFEDFLYLLLRWGHGPINKEEA